MPKTILITGANGRIGTALVKHIDSHNSDYHLILADLATSDTPFEHLLPSNIVGTYNVFQSASENKVKRIIYASSAQTIERYPLDIQVSEKMPTRPKNLYGVSKLFGESLGAYYAYQQNIEVIAIRIGALQYQQEYSRLSSRDLSAWSEPVDV